MSTEPRNRQSTRVLSPEYPLLGLLLAGPSHGYDLHQRLGADLGSVWHLSQSQVYSVLKRLEKRGDVSARRRPQSRLPARQVLRVTAAGRRRFMRWLEAEAGSGARTVRLEFLTRLYFARRLAPELISEIYATQAREVTSAIRRLRRQLSQIPDEQEFNRLSIDLRLRQMELVSHWLRGVRARFHIRAGDRR